MAMPGSIHKFQADIPTANIVAMHQMARDCRR